MPGPARGRTPRALLVDAAGTLLALAEPVGATYARFSRDHGVALDPTLAEQAFRTALTVPDRGPLIGDGRDFWARVVARTTGSADRSLFEALYAWYAEPEAWRLVAGWESLVTTLGAAGVPCALLSNWDTRLRPLLVRMGVSGWLPHQVISGEEGLAKPEAALFHRACERLGIPPAETLMVGDSRRDDVRGARAAGLMAVHWGVEVYQPQALLGRFGTPP